MKELQSKIDFLKSELDALRPIDQKHNQILWEKFRLEWNYNSNHIEGNTLTYGDTKLLLRLGDDFRAQNNSLKDVNEMRAHDVGIHLIKNWALDNERNLIEKDIRELNEIILVKDYWADAQTPNGEATRRLIKVGQYKSQPNHVVLKSGELFRYADPEEVPLKMRELLDWYDSQQDEHPLIVAALLHYKFVLIHPFDDGNGRVSRLLMNYHLMKHGYPPLIIKSKDKPNYLYALNQADAGNINAFIEYLANALIWSLEISIKAANGKNISEEDDLYKEIEVWKKELRSGISQDVVRTNNQSALLYKNSIAPLFKSIVEKSKVFNDLFLSANFNVNYKLENGLFQPIKFGMPGYVEKYKGHYIGFKLLLEFTTLLSKPNTKNKILFHFNCHLDVYHYYFSINDNVDRKFKHKYNQELNADKIEEISKFVIGELFQKIKGLS